MASEWNATQYGTFLEHRTRPARDLIARVALPKPANVIDLGCGPGNSTAVCAARWPQASILGLDSSPEMIETARAANPGCQFRTGGIGDWIREEGGCRCDVIFSNAALQWVEGHEDLFPRLVERLNPGGALAVQMPSYDAIPNRLMRELAASANWRKRFPDGRAKEWKSHSLEFYYTVLAPTGAHLDLWSTDYLQVMPGAASIVDWYAGTGLRPYLGCIPGEAEKARFLREFGELLEPHYPRSEGGSVLFSFRRLFMVARAG